MSNYTPDGMLKVSTENQDSINISFQLQQGVWIYLPDTLSVSGFSYKILDIDEQTFKDRVKTILLNNEVVDYPLEKVLHPGDRLVLSGAMPGLVGAMLRSDSPIKILRTSITSSVKDDNHASKEPLVHVKFFNTILKDFRQAILRNSFYIEVGDQ